MRIDKRIAYDGVEPRLFEQGDVLSLLRFVRYVINGFRLYPFPCVLVADLLAEKII